jgi:glutamyl-tRNA synthetase
MSLGDMIALFSEDGLLRKAAVFDPKKLEWMNGQHLSLMGAAQLEPIVTPAIVAAGLATEEELSKRHEWYLSLLDLLRVRARTIDDIVRQARPYFVDDIEYDPDAVAKAWKDGAATSDLLTATGERLAALPEWTAAPMEEALRAFAEERGTTAGKIFTPLRLALTGLSVSPGIFDVLLTLGRERSLARIAAGARAARGT